MMILVIWKEKGMMGDGESREKEEDCFLVREGVEGN